MGRLGHRCGTVMALVAAATWLSHSALRARAHEPTPAVLEVLATEAGVPSLLRTNIGLARALPDGSFEYLCPSRWDGNETTLAAADDEALVVISNGAAFLSRDLGDSFTRVVERDVRHVFTTPRGVRIVRWAGDATELLDAEGAVVDRFDAYLADDMHVFGEGLLASGSRPHAFVAAREGSTWRVLGDLDGPASRIVIADVHDDTAMLIATSRARVYVWAVTDLFTLPMRTEFGPYETLLGPVFDDGWIASLDGVRTSFGGGAWLDEGPSDWTSLHRDAGGEVWSARFGDVTRVSDEERVFSLEQLGPPRFAGCELDWAHFGGESGWLETEPARSPDGMRTRVDPPSGCAVGAHEGGAAPAVLLLAWLAIRVARRRSSC